MTDSGHTTVYMNTETKQLLDEISVTIGWPKTQIMETALLVFTRTDEYQTLCGLAGKMHTLLVQLGGDR